MVEKLFLSNEPNRTEVLRGGDYIELGHDDFSGEISLELGSSSLSILKVSELSIDGDDIPVYNGLRINPNRLYIITSSVDVNNEGRGVKGLRIGEMLQIGRNSDLATSKAFPSLTEDPYVSGSHMWVEVNESGGVSIHDTSTNGTRVSYCRVDNESSINKLTAESSDGAHRVKDIKQVSPEDAKYLLRMERIFKFPEKMGKDRFGNNLDSRIERSEDSKEAAVFAYRYISDPKIKEIIRSSAGDLWREEEMQEVLRKNDTVRLELGLYLLDKFESVSYLPRRVMLDSEKNGNHAGYESGLSSREYAALLALSMLDGSFNYSSTRHDPINRRYGDVESGQHRYAAAQVLGLEKTPYADRYLNIRDIE
ncbi:hypothetical protein H6796_00500 [Candidatus Nomurabacteria bacterium]|nr:hypothetical protein [Candidatus Nomurabacteria bacterium]